MSDAKLSSTRAELLRRGTRCGNELQLISMHAPCAVRATAGSTRRQRTLPTTVADGFVGADS